MEYLIRAEGFFKKEKKHEKEGIAEVSKCPFCQLTKEYN